MRLMTSAPYRIWELYLAAASRVMPEVRSTRCATTVVVPTSRARPKLRSEVSPRSAQRTSFTSLRKPTVAVTRPSPCHRPELPAGFLHPHWRGARPPLRHGLEQPLLVGRGVVEAGLGEGERELLHQRI